MPQDKVRSDVVREFQVELYAMLSGSRLKWDELSLVWDIVLSSSFFADLENGTYQLSERSMYAFEQLLKKAKDNDARAYAMLENCTKTLDNEHGDCL